VPVLGRTRRRREEAGAPFAGGIIDSRPPSPPATGSNLYRSHIINARSAATEAAGAIGRATAELIASGAAGRARRIGEYAPSFSLKDAEGNIVSSVELLKRGPLVVSFYRGVWCPYCNMELQALEAADLPTFNDDPGWTLPMPARYVIATDGRIRYANVNPDYTHRPQPEELIPALKAEAVRSAA
jgi:peroxiredoxin